MANESEDVTIDENAPDSPRSPRSDRMGAADEGSLEPGHGEPHEDETEEEANARVAKEDRERGVVFKAEAFNQNDGKGEMSEQREALKPQYQLGYPGDRRD